MTYPKLFQERLVDLFASPESLGIVVSIAYAFGAVAQLLMGRVLDRYSLKLPFVVMTLCQGPLLVAMAYADGWAVIALGAAFMFAVFGQVTVNDAMVANFVAPQWQARVFALRYFLSFGASAAAIPMIAFIEPRHGLVGLYLVLAVFGALTFAAALAFRGRRPTRPRRCPPEARPGGEGLPDVGPGALCRLRGRVTAVPPPPQWLRRRRCTARRHRACRPCYAGR